MRLDHAGLTEYAGLSYMERRSSRVLVAGLVLLVLGIGNWQMGSSKQRQYADRIAYAREIGGPGLGRPFRDTSSILEPRTTAHEIYDDSTAKYEYYRVVYRGGRLLMGIGCVLIAGALVRRALAPVR